MRKIVFIIVVALSAVSCGPKKSARDSAATPTLRVEAATVVAEPIRRTMRFQSLVYSNYDATIQPRVSGYLLTKTFRKGMPVEQGQRLFTIDSAPIRLQVEANRAALASAQTQLAEAKNNYQRAVPLAKIDAISQSSLDQYRATYSSAQAAVKSAQSALDESLLQLSYTTVTSPISGIIDDTGATVGDFVGPSSNYAVLATISNTEQIAVHLQIPFGRYLEARGATSLEGPSYDNQELLQNIRLYLSDGTLYPYEGTYSYTQRDAGSQTGTIIIVASFPNPSRALKIGQPVEVVAEVGAPEGVVLVPQKAVVQAQGICSVWVVASDSTVRYREVQVGDTQGDAWCIESGLEPGERVLLTGLQKVRNGMKIHYK
jgi:membrane fusion protein (multidrug efflux system)